MSIEALITQLIAALEANTAALQGARGSAPAAEVAEPSAEAPARRGRPPKAAQEAVDQRPSTASPAPLVQEAAAETFDTMAPSAEELLAEIRTTVTELCRKGRSNDVRNLLAEFQAKKAGDIAAADLPRFLGRLKEYEA